MRRPVRRRPARPAADPRAARASRPPRGLPAGGRLVVGGAVTYGRGATARRRPLPSAVAPLPTRWTPGVRSRAPHRHRRVNGSRAAPSVRPTSRRPVDVPRLRAAMNSEHELSPASGPRARAGARGGGGGGAGDRQGIAFARRVGLTRVHRVDAPRRRRCGRSSRSGCTPCARSGTASPSSATCRGSSPCSAGTSRTRGPSSRRRASGRRASGPHDDEPGDDDRRRGVGAVCTASVSRERLFTAQVDSSSISTVS